MPLPLNEALEIGKELSQQETTFLVEDSLHNYKVVRESYLSIGDVTSFTILPNQEIFKERMYKTPLGLCHSVTEILGATRSKSDSDRLRKWQHKMDKVNGAGSAQESSNQAKSRGTTIHSYIEKFLKGEMDLQSYPQDNYFLKVLPILKSLRSDWHEIEKFTYSILEYAGRFDLLAEFDGQLTLFDWKTSVRTKRKQWLTDAFLQTTAYALAESERKKTAINQLCIVVISPENCQVFVEEVGTYKEEWINRLNTFKQMKNA